jgi:hypothetical protein
MKLEVSGLINPNLKFRLDYRGFFKTQLRYRVFLETQKVKDEELKGDWL